MKLRYSYAVLSFCADMTDPRAKSRPVAVIGFGDLTAGSGFVAFAMNTKPGDDNAEDPVVRAMLNDLPSLLDRQSVEGLQTANGSGFLSWLHQRFRTSVHVAERAERELTVDELSPTAILNDVANLWKEIAAEAYAKPRASQPWRQYPRLGFRPLELSHA
jgi:hypothetical protein